ncbi:MAG: TMCO1/EMC3 family protein [Candidatus Thorarchaeota archaeon]|nr:TMCO1/EMC3 family protein [Candidatus Thorarchaeota archaeon]
MQDIFAALTDWFTLYFKDPPMSAILIMAVSVGITFISNLAMLKFSDVRRLKRYQAEIKAYQELSKKANEAGNEKLLRKVKRRKPYIDRIQKEMMTARCKPYMFFIIPFMLIFSFLNGFYIGAGGTPIIVAVIPFHIEKLIPFLIGWVGTPVAGGFGMYFFGFYMLVGLGLGQMLQRVMGTSLT